MVPRVCEAPPPACLLQPWRKFPGPGEPAPPLTADTDLFPALVSGGCGWRWERVECTRTAILPTIHHCPASGPLGTGPSPAPSWIQSPCGGVRDSVLPQSPDSEAGREGQDTAVLAWSSPCQAGPALHTGHLIPPHHGSVRLEDRETEAHSVGPPQGVESTLVGAQDQPGGLWVPLLSARWFLWTPFTRQDGQGLRGYRAGSGLGQGSQATSLRQPHTQLPKQEAQGHTLGTALCPSVDGLTGC